MGIPKQFLNNELRFCRVVKGAKKPIELDWTNKPHTLQEIIPFLDNENYGVLCGFGNLAVVDCDVEALQVAIEGLLPNTFRVKTGGGGTHNYFYIPEIKKKLILQTDDEVHLGEVQSYGTQVLAPESIHPNGNKYEILNDVEIATISGELLLSVIKPFIKGARDTEENVEWERREHPQGSAIDDLSVLDIWGTAGLKKHGNEYYGSHPIHSSEGGMNFWINPLKNTWHCFRCDSGGGVLSAIAVKEGIIDCSEAKRGNLRGDKAIKSLEIAKQKYGLKEVEVMNSIIQKETEVKIIWDNQLQDWKEEEREWIVDKLIPNKSVCILTGKRGSYKTFVTLLMSYAVSTGKSFLDNYPTKKGCVIYLDKENGVSIMKQRTRMIKKGLEITDKNIPIGFICFSQLKIDKLLDIQKIQGVIDEFHPVLLVIDTYRRGISFDENDAGAVSNLFVEILRPLVEKNNISILLIHHDRKAGHTGDEMEEMRGSSDLSNYADIILKTERKENSIIFKQLKNRNAREEEPIKINLNFEEETETIKMSYDGIFEKKTQVEKCVEILLIWITEQGIKKFKSKDAKGIAFKSGIKETNFKYALKLMQERNIIRGSFGEYEVIN
jgi:RecA-family ATPase